MSLNIKLIQYNYISIKIMKTQYFKFYLITIDCVEIEFSHFIFQDSINSGIVVFVVPFREFN